MRCLYSIFIVLFLCSCVDDDFSFRKKGEGEISIYIVKEGEIKIHGSPANFDIDKIELEAKPWVKNSEIELYDWSSHTFFLNTPKEKANYSGRHFVVVSGNERLFAGIFFPMHLSSIPQLPMITPYDGNFSPQDVIQFGQLGNLYTGEIRNNEKFKEALISAGLLYNGIQVELLQIEKKNQTDIDYTFAITNLDTNTLYVPDPYKMGESRFHYITNGVSFFNKNYYCFSTFYEHTQFDKFSEAWYYRLRPGQKITRTVNQKGFTCLNPGIYKCSFSYPGALIQAGEWKKPDGRIWLGNIYIEKELEIK